MLMDCAYQTGLSFAFGKMYDVTGSEEEEK